MKVVINRCYGGFGLSEKAQQLLCEYKGVRYKGLKEDFDYFDLKRNDPDLVRVVEELGPCASSVYAELKVVTIPDDVVWFVQDYDGMEWIAESHRTWS